MSIATKRNGGNGEIQPASADLANRPSAAITTTEVESRRAIAEVQAAIAIAKQFPRNVVDATERIKMAFTDPDLAEVAAYEYPRGHEDVSGPSIRAAEAMAQAWGNLEFGINELERRSGESTVQAYAWDLETNTRSRNTFQLGHFIDTKRGRKYLDDPRDIYEHTANMGARRKRACILGLIPKSVIKAAMAQAEETLRTKVDITPELRSNLVAKFAEFGVTKDAIEARIQRKLEAITPAQVVKLRRIYNSLKDGMSAPAEHFDVAAAAADAGNGGSRTDQLREKLGVDPKAPAAAEAPSSSTPSAAADKSDKTDTTSKEGGSLF